MPPLVAKKSVPSQPIVAPSEQRELPEKPELRQAEVRPPLAVMEDTTDKSEERSIRQRKVAFISRVFLLYDTADGCAR